MNNFEKIQSLQKKCQTYLRRCLEFWATTGYDFNRGGYYEAVTLKGVPLRNLNRRFRIQARNIFSHAAGTSQGYGDFLNVAEHAFDYTFSHYWQEGKGFATLGNAHGKILDSQVFTYDHAFTLLGFAWLYSITGKGKHRRGLENTWKIFQNRLRHPLGGIVTSLPPPNTTHSPMIQQNPHMHFFEALMEVYILTGEESWLQEAQKIYRLYRDYFYNFQDHVIREFFNDDYTPYLTKEWVDPGHHYEWTWLLNRYEKLSGEKVVSLPEIYQFAESQGKNKSELAYEFCSPNGNVIKSTSRMWSQTEQIKAHLTMYERTGKIKFFDFATASLDKLFAVFCNLNLPGVWYDRFDEEGNLVSHQSPASTLYHLFVCLQEFIRVSKTMETDS